MIGFVATFALQASAMGDKLETVEDSIAMKHYFRWEEKVNKLVESKQISKCTGLAFLFSRLAEVRNTPADKNYRYALLLFTHGPTVTSHGNSINQQLEQTFRSLPGTPRELPNYASNNRRFQEQLAELLKHRNETNVRPVWLWTHGTHSSDGPHQGWREGYVQRDFDRTGRHDHVFFHALITDHFERQTLLKSPGASAALELHTRAREESLELKDIASLLYQWSLTPKDSLYLDEDVRAVLENLSAIDSSLEKHRNVLKQLRSLNIKEHILRTHVGPKSGEYKEANDETKLLYDQKAKQERFLMAHTDIRSNRLGRALSRYLKKNSDVSPDQLNKWLHERMCDTDLALQKGLIKNTGPYTENLPD